MKIKIQTEIMSHLSDCQEMILYKFSEEAIRRNINYCKKLILRYPDTSVEVEEELNKIYKEIYKY